MKTSQQIADELTPHVAANNASIGETNARIVVLGDGQGNPQPPNPLTPRDVYYHSKTDESDRGVAVLDPQSPIMLDALDGYYDTEVWLVNPPRSTSPHILAPVDSGLRSTGGATPAEGLIRAGAFPSQDRLAILRLRPSPHGGLSLVVDVGVYQIAYEIPAGGYNFLGTGEIDASDPTNTAVFTGGGAVLTSGQHCILGIAFDPTLGALVAIQGTPVTAAGSLPSRSEFSPGDYSAIDFTGLYPAGYAYSYDGQTDFVEDDCLRLFDPRLFMKAMGVGGGSGDVTGPGSSVDHTLARFDGTTGKIIEDTGITVDDSDNTNIPGRLTTQSGRQVHVRVVTASGAVTATNADEIIVVNKTSGAATTVNLYSAPGTGDVLCIKDGKGDAATNNITITPASGNIDGASTYVINVNYGGVFIAYDGSQWRITTFFQTGSSSPLTTKGDLYTHSTVDARLPVGEDYSELIPDVTQATGLRWDSPLWGVVYNYDFSSTGDPAGQIGFGKSNNQRRFSRKTEPAVPNGGGGAFDQHGAHDACLVQVGGVLWIFYSGYNGTNWDGIGVSRSYDQGVTWTKYGSNPVITPNSTGWEATNGSGVGWIQFSTVLYDVTEPNAARRWKMFYAGGKFGAGGIGYAYGPDGISWTKSSANPVMVPTSGWRSALLVPGAVVKLTLSDGTFKYYLFYNGSNGGSPEVWSAGVITFTDPEGTYTDNPNNPLLVGDGINSAITSNVSIGDQTIAVTDSSVFPISAAVYPFDSGNRYLTYVDSRPDGTHIHVTDPAPLGITAASGGNVRSPAYHSVNIRSAEYDGGFILGVVGFQPQFDTGQVHEHALLGYADDALTAAHIDYSAGLIVRPTLAESAAAGHNVSMENPFLVALADTPRRLLGSLPLPPIKASQLTTRYVPLSDSSVPDLIYASGEVIMVEVAN